MKDMLHGTDGDMVQDGKINTTQNESKCSQFQTAFFLQSHMNMNCAIRDSLVAEGLLYLCFDKTKVCVKTLNIRFIPYCSNSMTKFMHNTASDECCQIIADVTYWQIHSRDLKLNETTNLYYYFASTRVLILYIQNTSLRSSGLSSLYLVFGKIRVGTVSCHLSEVKVKYLGLLNKMNYTLPLK
jgi:hypothetical protein